MSPSSHFSQVYPILCNLCFYTCPSLPLKQFLPSPPSWPLLFLPVSAKMFLLPGSPPDPPGCIRSQRTFLQCSMFSLWQGRMHHMGRVWLPSDLFTPENKSGVVTVAGKGWSGGCVAGGNAFSIFSHYCFSQLSYLYCFSDFERNLCIFIIFL